MTTAAVSISASVLWLLVVFAVVALWFVAISDIASRVRNHLFTRAQLASMAVLISIFAVISIGAAGAVLLNSVQTDMNPAKYDRILGANYAGCGGSRSSFVFSFGLERASYTSGSAATDNVTPRAYRPCEPHG